ncbi:hypothetical protein [Marinobacter sp. ELB17]|uniref:hypothetical protein n=1 Tax=Marinobacter sp. ELB17 TaxID=270374 RepID=UPI0000F3ABC7|nr:hypothetical protein [Marinobacter sp. ELB17]EAZ97153.1 hypothetical protein MELB17_10993 [Marinobacter sp. ELB17]
MDSLENLIHDCDQMPKNGVAVRSGSGFFEDDDLGWCLFVERLATEDDLQENHYLEEVGEMIWMTAVEIKFCPYCGEKLVAAQSESPTDDFGYFVHIDSSSWLRKRR